MDPLFDLDEALNALLGETEEGELDLGDLIGEEDDIDFMDSGELALLLDEEEGQDGGDDEDLEAEAVSFGRVHRAGRVRRIFDGSATDAEAVAYGYERGFLDAMERLSGERMGFAGLSALAGLAGRGVMSAVRRNREEGEDRPSLVDGFRAGAGLEAPLGATIGHRLGAWWAGRAELPADLPVAGSPDELPPVLVADDRLGRELTDDEDTVVSDTPVHSSTRFGALHRPSRNRSAAWKAAEDRGLARMKAGRPSGASAFVSDPRATPVLFESGEIAEPVYGQLQLVPCPSCAAHQGCAECSICEGHGGILVPDDDVDALISERTHYGIVGLLALGTLAGVAGGTALSQNEEFKKRSQGAISGWMGKKGGKKKKGKKGKAGKKGAVETVALLEEDVETEIDPFDSDLDALEAAFDDDEVDEVDMAPDDDEDTVEVMGLVPASYWRARAPRS